MGSTSNLSSFLLLLLIPFFIIIIQSPIILINSQPYDYPMANLSTSWVNSVSAKHSVNFTDGSTVRAILLRGSFGPKFACGFYCNGDCNFYLFAIFIVQTNSGSGITSPNIGFPPVVWSANRDNPVKINSTLKLTSDGDLVLRDVDGRVAWSTNTKGKSVSGLNLTDMGNLILFDTNNSAVWQSFDHPTDSLVPGQKLFSGTKLTASVSETNWTQLGGLYSLSVTNEGLFAFIESNPPPLVYYQNVIKGPKENKEPSYIRYLNGSLAFFLLSSGSEPDQSYGGISISSASSAQYIKLFSDGHLRVYDWERGWKMVGDVFAAQLSGCGYPMVCGKYGICTNWHCNTPSPIYFREVDARQRNLGYSEITPLNCQALDYQKFVELKEIRYFTFISDVNNTDVESCKQACLNNCSCKAVFFRYGSDSSSGDCYLPSEVFSLINNEYNTYYNSSAFLKVQDLPTFEYTIMSPTTTPNPTKNKKNRLAVILGSTIGLFFVLCLIIWFVTLKFRKDKLVGDDEEDYLDQVPGMPTRFSYEDLKAATDNYSKKLGQGGFGSVFEGTLKDGTKIAVKCLEGIGQINKSFLAEVETIGSIHHVNLVRLIGFCADKSHRLLVYEYMSNGSLDKWIYHKNGQLITLDWKSRKKIVLEIAKGLAYLHEDCRQKIVHLDIKPQNILLDENFNAKVSDFGLSKLLDRDQIQVVTTMRGTPGYLAPEWLSSVITEKVDVYSYGVVILEILCGRKNLDRSKPEEDMHLLRLFQRKADEGKLLDIVDGYSEDMQEHGTEVVEMMRIAAWCLQSDFAKRPTMSVVVKVLEGVMEVECNLDYNFSNPPVLEAIQRGGQKILDFGPCTPLLPSVLSGPR